MEIRKTGLQRIVGVLAAVFFGLVAAAAAAEPVWPADPWPLPRSLAYSTSFRVFSSLQIRAIRGPAGNLYGSPKTAPKIPVSNHVPGSPIATTWAAKESPTFDPVSLLLNAVLRANNRVVKLAGPVSSVAPVLFVNIGIARPRMDHMGTPFADESYSILVSAGSSTDIEILAETPLGALRAISTLPQLVAINPTSSVLNNISYPAYAIRSATILDSPWRSWRGLMLDVARTYFPIPDIKRTIDAMEVTKMNVLHLHLFDSEAFPLQYNGSDGGRAWKNGAKRLNGVPLIYSPASLRDLAYYAFQRGVYLHPGVEGPAHVDILARAYPALVTCNPDPISAKSGQLNPFSRVFPVFIQSFYSWLLDDAFPKSSGVQLGGDEFHPWCWETSWRIPRATDWWASTMKWSYAFLPALNYYFRTITNVLSRAGKKPRFAGVWEDAIIPPYGTTALPKNATLVQSWRGVNSLTWLLARGWQALFSVEDYWYLDCGEWCFPGSGARPMPTLYSAPVPSSTFLIGGEAVAFTENWIPSALDRAVWPRAAAVSERLWLNPSRTVWGRLCTYDRVGEVNRQLLGIGVVGWPVETVMI